MSQQYAYKFLKPKIFSSFNPMGNVIHMRKRPWRQVAAALFVATLASGPLHAQAPITITIESDELKTLGLDNLPPEQARTQLLQQLRTLQSLRGPGRHQSPVVAEVTKGASTPEVPSVQSQAVVLPNTPAPGPANASPTEESLAAQLASLPALSVPLKIEKQKDGFKVNGQSILDSEGAIGLYSVNPLNGDFTYMVRPSSGRELIIKTGRATINQQPIVIARAAVAGNGWTITTATGKTLDGDRIIPSAKGFVVARSGSAFFYQPGVGTTNISIPAGYSIAQFQNGDVGTTRYLLIEKNTGPEKAGGLGTVLALGSMLGMSKKEDYALIDIDKGLPLYLDIAVEGKTETVMSNCYRKSANSLVNYCNTATSFESLYDPKTGLPNFSHYYWRLSWYSVPDGRKVLISQQGGLSKVTITNLDTGSNRVLFERMLGIAGFSTSQNSAGTIQVTAKLGFQREQLTDALSVLDGAVPKPEPVGGFSLF